MGRRKRKVFLWQQNFSGAPKKLKPLKINVRYITTFIYIFNLVKKAMTLESGGNTEQEDVSEHLDSGEMSPDINQELRILSTR